MVPMNTHEASNICSKVAQEKLILLEELLPRITSNELPRFQKTIDELREAIDTLNSTYPLPLGINVTESINLVDRFGG